MSVFHDETESSNNESSNKRAHDSSVIDSHRRDLTSVNKKKELTLAAVADPLEINDNGDNAIVYLSG